MAAYSANAYSRLTIVCPAGTGHVLTGPDHLSALAMLSVGTTFRAFVLGVRWGVGHSLGLFLVAVVFFLSSQQLDLDRVGRSGAAGCVSDLYPPCTRRLRPRWRQCVGYRLRR